MKLFSIKQKKRQIIKNSLDVIFGMGYIATSDAPVAQLDRVPDYESGGHRFESCLVYQEISRGYHNM